MRTTLIEHNGLRSINIIDYSLENRLTSYHIISDTVHYKLNLALIVVLQISQCSNKYILQGVNTKQTSGLTFLL